MADLPPDAGNDNGVRPTADRPPGTPRWVKVFGIIAILFVLLIVIMLLSGHCPGRHSPSGDAGSRVALSSVVEDFGHTEGDGA